MFEPVVPHVSHVVKLYSELFTLVGPFGVIPIYLGITQERSVEERKVIVKKTALWFFIIGVSTMIVGQPLLHLFKISLDFLSLAGGVYVASLAWKLGSGDPGSFKHTEEEDKEAAQRTSIAMVPLAMPLLIGPATMSKIMVEQTTWWSVVHLVAVLFALSVTVYALLCFADPIARRLGTAGFKLINRITGLLSFAVALKMMFFAAVNIIKATDLSGICR